MLRERPVIRRVSLAGAASVTLVAFLFIGAESAGAGQRCWARSEGVCLFMNGDFGPPQNWYHNGFWDGTFHDDVYANTSTLLADSVSSTWPYSGGACGAGYLREHVNFTGNTFAFVRGGPAANVTGTMNDKASSIQWSTSLFIDQNCYA